MTDAIMNTSETPGIILGVGEWASGYTSVDMGEDGIVGMVTFHAVTPGEYEVGEDVEMDSLIDKSRPDFMLAFANTEAIDVLVDRLQLIRSSMVNGKALSAE